MKELINNIEQWATDRNIIDGSKPIDQAMKLFSEFGELADHVGNNEIDKLRDDIGDVFVVLTIMAKQTNTLFTTENMKPSEELKPVKEHVGILNMSLGAFVAGCHSNTVIYGWLKDAICELKSIASIIGTTLEECVEEAYNDIKDRKGVLYEGVFIKESNPAYKDALIKLGKI